MFQRSCYRSLLFGLLLLIAGLPESVAEPVINIGDPDLALRWNTLQSGEVRLVSSISGDAELEIRFPHEGDQWPQIRFEADRGALETTDFSQADQIIIDVRNPNPQRAVLSMALSDSDGRTLRSRFTIAPLSNERLVVALPQGQPRADRPDLRNIRLLNFYTHTKRLEGDLTLYLSDVRLVNRADERRKEYSARVQTLLDWIAEEHISIESASDEVMGLARSAHELRRTLDEINEREGLLDNTRMDEIEDRLLDAEALPVLRSRFEVAAGASGASLLGATAMTKVHIHAARLSADLSDDPSIALNMARNESESRQVVVLPVINSVGGITWQLPPLFNAAGDRLDARVNVVGYVKTSRPPYDVAFEGWWADPLLTNIERIDELPLGEVLSLFITVSSNVQTPPGVYQSELRLRISSPEAETLRVPIQVTVDPFVLPVRSSIPVVFTPMPQNDDAQRIYPDTDLVELRSRIEDLLLEHRISPANMYRVNDPGWTVERIREMIDKGLSCFVLGYFGYSRAHRMSFDDFYTERRVNAFPLWHQTYRNLRAAGWNGPTLITFFDESPIDYLPEMQEAWQRLREEFPSDVAIMPVGTLDPMYGGQWSTENRPEHWTIVLNKFGTEDSAIQAFRDRGGDVWVYTCLTAPHPYPMFYVEYDGVEPRLLGGAVNWKLNAEGMMYYRAARWPANKGPLRVLDGRRTDWNPASNQQYNGSGSLICAGADGPLSTIRLVNLRDGLEDYEYYRLADSVAASNGLKVSTEVMKSLTQWTTDPDVILRERDRLRRAILGANKDR